jgi:tetratricopeptide (TPR) repeat protein
MAQHYLCSQPINIDSLKQLITKEKNYEKNAAFWFIISGQYGAEKNDSLFNYAIEQCLSNVLQSKNDTQLGYFYSSLGQYYEEKPNLNLSLEYQLKALKIFENIKIPFGIALAAEQCAAVYKELKNSEEAYKYLSIAKKYIGDTLVKKSFLMRGINANLAEVFFISK